MTSNSHVFKLRLEKLMLRGPSTLTWELLTGDFKITLEDKTKNRELDILYIVRKPKRC